jgi:hypothetical protein
MIRGFYVARENGTTTVANNLIRWSPIAGPVNIMRSRVAMYIQPTPWNLVEGDTLNFLIPRGTSSSSVGYSLQLKTVVFTGSLPTTGQELVDYVNGLRIDGIEAVIGVAGSVYIVSTNIEPYIQVVAHNTTVMSKFSLHSEPISTGSYWELIAIADPTGHTEGYDAFDDTYGLASDIYRLKDVSGNSTSPVRHPLVFADSSCSVCCLEGTLKNLNGTPRALIKVGVHEVPPSEPDNSVVQSTPLQGPGWPINILRPLDVIPPAERNKLWNDTYTDSYGFFSIICQRGHRVYIEINDLSWFAIVDIPEASYLDVSELSSWKRTGMLGPLD